MRLRHFLPQSLFARTLLILCVPTVLVQLVTSFVFYDRHFETLVRRMAGALGGEIAFVAEQVATTAPAARPALLQQAGQNLHLQFQLLPLEGMELPEPQPLLPLDELIANTLDERLDQNFYSTMEGDTNTIRVIVQLDDAFLIATANKNRLFSYTTNLVIWWMVGSSVLLFGIAIIFLRNQIRPIRKLAAAAEELGKGRDTTDLKPSGAIEVRQATRAFALMRERIKRQMQQRTEMLAGISHDLRTPLTRMKLELALLPRNPDIQAMQQDVEEMRQMVDSYLDFARGDSDEAISQFAWAELWEEIEHNLQRQGHALTLRGILDGHYTGRRQAVKRCLNNLVENACRYGTAIAVSGERKHRHYYWHIDDNGPGIPAEQYEEVFRPFRRLDESRNPDTGGVGLGLSIARDIARSHGGDIRLGKSNQGGLRATLILPE
jgi:two-component system, OmpR family, osmolarity sensor histidine kinase EnvZ